MNSRFAQEMARWTEAQLDCQVLAKHVAGESARLFRLQGECQQMAEKVRVQQGLETAMPPLRQAA